MKVAGLPSRSRASETPLIGGREWIYAADHGRRGDLRSRQNEGADPRTSACRPSFVPARVLSAPGLCRSSGRFHEEGESAKSTDRSQLQNLLTYCRLNNCRFHFVVVFNLTRFARDKSQTTSRCARICQSLGISLRSARSRLRHVPRKLMEGVPAAFRAVRQRRRSAREPCPSSQVPPRKRDTRPALQVAFEPCGPFFVGKLDNHVYLPRLAGRGVNAASGVVNRETRLYVRRQARVVPTVSGRACF